jgi:hypothetical protein
MGHRLWYPRGQSLAILQSELTFADKSVGYGPRSEVFKLIPGMPQSLQTVLNPARCVRRESIFEATYGDIPVKSRSGYSANLP